MAVPRICSIEGCGKRSHSRYLCIAHYAKWSKYGDPLANPHGLHKRGEALRYLKEIVLNFSSDECLFWPFPRGKKGYGFLQFEGRSKEVHRVTCRLAHGEPPTPKHETAHTCGKGHLGCVNPRHLRWATHKENINDKRRHGTIQIGADHPRSKLTIDEVNEIRKMEGSMSQRLIAEKFGVNQVTISLIHRGKTWQHSS